MNKSITDAVFPEIWRKALVKPLFDVFRNSIGQICQI